MTDRAFHRSRAEMVPERPAPIISVGVIGWVRSNLFSTWLSVTLTLVSLALLALILPPLIDWTFLEATYAGASGKDCTGAGACWAWFDQRIDQFVYGFYPQDAYWRANLAVVLLVPAVGYLLFANLPYARLRALVFARLSGDRGDPAGRRVGAGGGPDRPVRRLRAQPRRRRDRDRALASHRRPARARPALAHADRARMFSVAFIEFIRGVPLITLLFVAIILLPIFLPQGGLARSARPG